LTLLLSQVVIWGLRHRSSERWAETWTTGSEQERLDAAHVLLNRGSQTGRTLGPGLAASLLNIDAAPRVRTLAFSSDVCKLQKPLQQLSTVVNGLERGRPRALIDFVLQCRKVGGIAVGSSSAMRRCELNWYYRAGETEAWPADVAREIDAHLAPTLNSIRAYLDDS